MEEHKFTVDGPTYRLHPPFIVMATQNPVEMEGTYPLPEAQRDRFMARISMGYPSADAEMDMLDRHAGQDPDRKSTRLNSSHANISYAVFCLKKKKRQVTTAEE